jgi:hypothetical protein
MSVSDVYCKMRNISQLLTQLQGLGVADEDVQVEVPHSSGAGNKTEAELGKEGREERAREMFARYKFDPFIAEGVDMVTTYKEGVRCMYTIFKLFFRLDSRAINRRTWRRAGKEYTDGLVALLQNMGILIVETWGRPTIMHGIGKILYDNDRKNQPDTPELVCLAWFRRLNEYGLNIASTLECLNLVLEPGERVVMDQIWTKVQNFMQLFQYHYQAPANFVKRQAVWVYREGVKSG